MKVLRAFLIGETIDYPTRINVMVVSAAISHGSDWISVCIRYSMESA